MPHFSVKFFGFKKYSDFGPAFLNHALGRLRQ
jgi:hypothetical protein